MAGSATSLLMDNFCRSVLRSVNMLDNVVRDAERRTGLKGPPSAALAKFIVEHRGDAEWLVRRAAQVELFGILATIDERRELGGPGSELSLLVGGKRVTDESLHERFIEELARRGVQID